MSEGGNGSEDPFVAEQRYIDGLYERLEQLRGQTAARLADARLQQTRHQQSLMERDAEIHLLENVLARYDFGGGALCFGRIDLDEGARYYIGRLGLSDENIEPLLVDWRAPVAEPFYRATARQPEGVALRRHLLCEGRRLLTIDDEVFDANALDDGERRNLRGEAALIAALERHRTGRMGDIVATIQGEQDAVIRSPLEGVLLVQGGPGTGKTAVALHRAAYLLYTHRERLTSRGVLIVGPSRVFLRYIEQVLPALGETGAVLARVGDLYPGVAGRRPETPEVVRIKGQTGMLTFLRRAVRTRQRILRDDAPVGLGALQLTVTAAASQNARRRARASGHPHNRAKSIFDNALLDELMRQAEEKEARIGRPLANSRRKELRASLKRSREFRAVAYRLWPELTPQELLGDLFSARVLIRAAGRGVLSEDDVAALHRPPSEDGNHQGWSAADVPLLDEAAELLGEAVRPRSHRRRQREEEVPDLRRPLEEVARGDRTWTYGHVIVDEAQEISPMAWRMLVRRCPHRSMTVVGDWAQRSVDWGAGDWKAALGPAANGLRPTELTINYRTPEEAMTLASAVLAEADPDLEAPSAIRSSGFVPWAMRAAADALGEVAAGVAGAEIGAVGDGRIAVVVPDPVRSMVADALRQALGDRVATDVGNALERPVSVLGVGEAKGLEFDSVVVVEPSAIVEASARGSSDLYVALTRTTNRLGIIHSRPLPASLTGARPVSSMAAIG